MPDGNNDVLKRSHSSMSLIFQVAGPVLSAFGDESLKHDAIFAFYLFFTAIMVTSPWVFFGVISETRRHSNP